MGQTGVSPQFDDVSAFFCVSIVGIVFVRAQLAAVASPAQIPAVHDHGACTGVPSVPRALLCVLLPLHTRVLKHLRLECSALTADISLYMA